MPPFAVRSKNGGGAVPWKRLTVDPGAIVDTGGLTTTGTGFDATTGRMTIVYGAHILQVDGYQEAVANWNYPLLSLIPNFNPDRDTLEFKMEFPALPHVANVAAGIFIGIADSTTIATRKACVMGVRTSTVGTDILNLMDPASGVTSSNPGLTDAAMVTMVTGSDGTNYPYAATAQALIEGTTRWQQMVANQDSDNVLLAPTSNWQVIFGAWHGSVTPPLGQTIVADLSYRVV